MNYKWATDARIKSLKRFHLPLPWLFIASFKEAKKWVF
jgi:hypothetical protein